LLKLANSLADIFIFKTPFAYFDSPVPSNDPLEISFIAF
jgi:hypothetical protein